MSYAEKAVGHLKANQVPASPRNYELWYTYVSGFNRALNRALNEAITRYGSVPESVLQEIYEQFLSPSRITDRVQAVGDDFLKEFERVIGAIDEAKGSTSSYGKTLENAAQSLVGAHDRDQVKRVAQMLISSTKEMEARSKALEEQLSESRKQIDTLQENLEAVRSETITDALTGIANRKHFDETIKKAIKEAREIEEPLTLVLGDIDHFKNFNDSFCHQTGDQVLRLVAHALKTNVKGRDLAARYGGEEFAVILPQTNLQNAVTVADQIRKTILAKELVKKSTGESLGTITMSFGAASLRPDDTVDSLIARADKCLYAAKKAGRNQVKSEADADIGDLSDVA